jgi:soluble lytic murein transglycosylase-like protein
MLRGGLFLCALGVVVVLPSVASADIYYCEGPGGEVSISHERVRGWRCRIEGRDSPRPPASSTASAATRPPVAAVAPPAARPYVPMPVAPETGDRFTRYDVVIAEAARLYQLPADFVRAVVKVESNFNPNAVSRTGAIGLMQLMPGTARSMGVVNPFDPRQNIFGGTRYLRFLANTFRGDLVLTVAAYNAGEGAVQRYHGVPPYDETRRYVQRVLHHYYNFRNGTGTVRDRR